MIILKSSAIIALTATLSFSIFSQDASAQSNELTFGDLNNGKWSNKDNDHAELPTRHSWMNTLGS